jgi:Flp pilus assembly pilin Flp
MSDLITTTQDAFRNACIDLYFGGKGLVDRTRDEERGQTAAEYTGVVLLVMTIIVGVIAADIDEKLKTGLQNIVQKILDAAN